MKSSMYHQRVKHFHHIHFVKYLPLSVYWTAFAVQLSNLNRQIHIIFFFASSIRGEGTLPLLFFVVEVELVLAYKSQIALIITVRLWLAELLNHFKSFLCCFFFFILFRTGDVNNVLVSAHFVKNFTSIFKSCHSVQWQIFLKQMDHFQT